MTDTLEKQGWARRERLDSDWRIVRVHLPAKGSEIGQVGAVFASLEPARHKVFGAVRRQLRHRSMVLTAGS